MKVSFIIPIYKVEQYLEQCVNSVLNQTYRDIEVILVDDGSPDGCPKLCDTFAERDSRVRVLHKANGGLSDARNAGLLVATGDYIIFVDGDDFWHDTSSLETLVSEICHTPNCDFIGFNCSYYIPSNNKREDWVAYDCAIGSEMSSRACIRYLVQSGTFPMSACLKILNRKFLLDNALFFKKGVYSEDIPWFIDLLSKSSSCRFINNYIYSYRKEVEGSISSTFSQKKWDDLFCHLREGVSSLVSSEINSTSEALLSFWAYEYYILVGMLGFVEVGERRRLRKELFRYDWLVKYDINPKVRKVNLLRRFMGVRLTCRFLHFYIKRKVSK